MTLKQAADAGMCTVQEEVVVMAESPIYAVMLTQTYKRHDDGTIELLDARDRKDCTGYRIAGRFNNWFPAPTTGKPQ